jgi:hypothetical protein
MIRIDAVWLATEPMDMRAGTDTALARVVKVFGAAHTHQAYLFANRRAVEREVKNLHADAWLKICQARSKPLADAMQEWMQLQRQKITDGSATAKALDYSLRRWGALTRFLDDGQLPIDNNWIENQIRPIAIWTKQLVVCGLAQSRAACGCRHEPDTECQAQWA